MLGASEYRLPIIEFGKGGRQGSSESTGERDFAQSEQVQDTCGWVASHGSITSGSKDKTCNQVLQTWQQLISKFKPCI